MSDRFHRPIAILARKQRGWRLLPDTFREAARAFFWRHRMLEAALIAFLMAAAGFAVTWWALRGWR